MTPEYVCVRTLLMKNKSYTFNLNCKIMVFNSTVRTSDSVMTITSVASGVFFFRCVIFGRRKSFLKLDIFMAMKLHALSCCDTPTRST